MSKLLLGSGSPRRKEIIETLNFPFKRVSIDCEEDHPTHLDGEEIALFLAEKKSLAYSEELEADEVLLTADTVVWKDGVHLAKPHDRAEAISMLKDLSGSSHQVITGVGLRTSDNLHVFAETTQVVFRELSEKEIDFYVDNYQPFDKAGAYGIQEWIGMIGIQQIKGCYFNVVGLPCQRLVVELRDLGIKFTA